MSIKVQHQEMIMSAKRINAQTEKLNHIQRELQTMLNSTDWDMRVRRSMESRLEETRKLNRELTLIVKNMSQMVDKTAESMKEKDNQLGKIIAGGINNRPSYNNDNSYTGNDTSKDSSGDGGLSFFKTDNKFGPTGNMGVNHKGENNADSKFQMGISGSVIDYENDMYLGNSAIGGGVGVDIDVGHTTVEGSVGLDIKEGDFFAEGEIGAYVGKGGLSGSINLGPITVEGGVGGSYGIGIGGKIGIDDLKFSIKGNAALGLGGSAFISVGLNKEWLKSTFK